MKKILLTFITLLTLTLVLSSCECNHEWTNATCTVPKTCSVCNETVGKALGHTWVEATCITPKTCSRCNEVYEDGLGTHEYTFEITKQSTCTEDGVRTFTCKDCFETGTEVVPANHTWEAATCTTPKTCTVCGVSEGTALGHTTEEGTCSRCNLTVSRKWSYDDANNLYKYANKSTESLVSALQCVVDAYTSSDPVFCYQYAITYVKIAKLYFNDILLLSEEKVDIELNGGDYATLQEFLYRVDDLFNEIVDLEITSANYKEHSSQIYNTINALSESTLSISKLGASLCNSILLG